MISVAEAAERIERHARTLESETIPLSEAAGRVLAEDVIAARNQPAFAVSAMDGYAVRQSDVSALPATLRVTMRLTAGQPPSVAVGQGEAARIFTGGIVPQGADTIVLQESATEAGGAVTVQSAPAAGRHIRTAGIDFCAGDMIARKGTRVTPRLLSLIAAASEQAAVSVARRPRVAILATGDELMPAGAKLKPGQIIASSGHALSAMLQAWGAEPMDLGIAPDDEDAIKAAAAKGAGADVLVTLGGASVGEPDLVRSALAGAGLQVDFWKIAMRPGKPLMFGRMGAQSVLGLPGNPVSALVCALLFLRPLVLRLQGVNDTKMPRERWALAEALAANDTREDYLRAEFLEGGRVRAFTVQDSSMLSALARADALIVRPPHAPAAPDGEIVEVIRLTTAYA